jgi:hypothetical protein
LAKTKLDMVFKPNCEDMSKNPKFSILFLKFSFFFSKSYLIFKPKLQVFWLVFAILGAFFVKIDFFNEFL